MADEQIADTEPADTVDGSELDGPANTIAERAREEQLRALAALHGGGVGDDLLPGVGPILDDTLFVVREWPLGWVAA